MANLKIVNINGKAVIETWSFAWITRIDQAWMNNIEEARKWCVQALQARKFDCIWDVFDEVQTSVNPVVEMPVIEVIETAVVAAVVVTKSVILEFLDTHVEYSDRYVEYLRGAVEIDDIETAIKYANSELYWVRKMEECEMKTERKAVLNGFKKLVKKLVA